MIELFNIDCMEYMATIPDKYFDLAVVDPPYGIGEDGRKTKSRAVKSKKWNNPKPKNYKICYWDNEIPPLNYFNEIKRISKNQIIWGANHFGNMEPSSGWIVWYKKNINDGNDFSDCEIAFTSYNKGIRLFHLPWVGFGAVNAKEERIHPTQKPVKLYDWIYKNYLPQGGKVIDTHLGSGSNAIAAHKAGNIDFVGCELDKDYFDAASKRYNEFKKQLTIF